MIILSTLNARYIHTSLGLRYLKANLAELQEQCQICEFIINSRPLDMVEQLLALKPRIIGFGVYIWNVQETTQVVMLLKQIAPEITIVLGGPEVSFEQQEQQIVQQADYVICGAAEKSFAALCRQLLAGQRPLNKIINSPAVALNELTLPYDLYDENDIKNRLIYVEASRGCPFKCEFCLSALDKTAKPFELTRFLEEMAKLYQRGVRHFKFIDRTFNLKIAQSLAILDFFLQHCPDVFLHFELIPDHLPDELKQKIALFRPGSLQFEIGIQSFNPTVQQHISRRQDNQKSCDNIQWLRQHTSAHLHTDLIVGLPGETLTSFAAGFNQLVALNPHEIQVGILKRLRGTPIIRHTNDFKMVYNPLPPYNILSNDQLDFFTLQQLNRFARFWDLIGNSGRFKTSRPLILGEQPFERFLALSDWLFQQSGATYKIALDRLFNLVFLGCVKQLEIPAETAITTLSADYQAAGFKGEPPFAKLFSNTTPQRGGGRLGTVYRQGRHGEG